MIRLKKVLLLLFILHSGYLLATDNSQLATDNSQEVEKIFCQLSLKDNRTLEEKVFVPSRRYNRHELNDICRSAFDIEDDEETFSVDYDSDDDDGERVYTIFFADAAVEIAYLERLEIRNFEVEVQQEELENDALVAAELGVGRTFTACAGPETNDDSD